jgi:hypothetical protein
MSDLCQLLILPLCLSPHLPGLRFPLDVSQEVFPDLATTFLTQVVAHLRAVPILYSPLSLLSPVRSLGLANPIDIFRIVMIC